LVWPGPKPSFPLKLAPQVQTVPSDFRTMVPLAPPQIEVTSGAATANPSARKHDARMSRNLYFIGASITHSSRFWCCLHSFCVEGSSRGLRQQPTTIQCELMSIIRSSPRCIDRGDGSRAPLVKFNNIRAPGPHCHSACNSAVADQRDKYQTIPMNSMNSASTRRHFLGQSAVALAAFAVLPGAPAQRAKPAANWR
jgi:hypothetical protein